MSEEHIGRTCPYCQAVIKPQDDVVVCSQCSVAHHKECWDANGGCTTLSCAGGAASQAVARPMPPRMPAPPVTRTPQPAPRKSRKLARFLVLVLLLVAGGVGYCLGWYLNVFPWPVSTIAGTQWMVRYQLHDLKTVHRFLESQPPQSRAVYAQGIQLLPEPGWTMYYTKFPVVTEDALIDWFVYNHGGYYVFLTSGHSEDYTYPNFFTLVAEIPLSRSEKAVLLRWRGVPLLEIPFPGFQEDDQQQPQTDIESASARQSYRGGMRLLSAGQVVEARGQLSSAVLSGLLPPDEQKHALDAAIDLADKTIFSSQIYDRDACITQYTFQPGEALAQVERKLKLHVPNQLIVFINGLERAEDIRAGRKYKMVRGPFHAIIHKGTFTMDVYLHPEGEKPVFIRRLTIGMGANGATPVGLWRIRLGGKARRPTWYPPPNSPLNPDFLV